MNKKAITAIENKKLLKNIKKNNNIKFIYKNIQYREAIIEILKKEKDIGIIFISEDIPGEISIEELINEIKLINKKIEIIFFLNKKNKNKEEKLKKIKENNITKQGTELIYSENQAISYNISYTTTVTNYKGRVQVIVTDKLPKTIDESKSNIAGGEYDSTNKTITWKQYIPDVDTLSG